jgi:RNA polymerase primary sigma factor
MTATARHHRVHRAPRQSRAGHHRHNPGDSLSSYLEEIAAYPLLSREDESILGQRARAGDASALDALVCANLRFVVAVAKKYQHQGVALADLINEGNLGLLRAAQKFDDTKGVKFISYAVWWIRQAIVQALAEHSHVVRVPVGRAGALYRINRRANALRHELGREPTQEELARDLDVSPEDLAVAAPVSRPSLSFDAPMGEDGGANLLDVVTTEDGAATDDDIVEEGTTEHVAKAMSNLPPREALILRLYFGFDGSEGMTLDAIGEQLGITRERVRQIKERALSRLRKGERGHVLASLAGR